MKHFVYVFSAKERDILLARNYKLIQSDEQKNVYIFENQHDARFDLQNEHIFESDILSL